MPRLLPVALFAAMVGGMLLLPTVDPVRVAAFQAGTLMQAPALFPADVPWRSTVDAGDRVELEDGRAAEVVAVEGDRVEVRPADGGESLSLSTGDLAAMIEKRPLWRYLLEGPAAVRDEHGNVTLRVRGYRMNLSGTPYKDQRLHARVFESVRRALLAVAAEKGFELEFEQRMSQTFPGLMILANRGEGTLEMEVYLPDGRLVGARERWEPATNLSLLPPLVAILLAMLFRRPGVALGAGVVVGAVLERRAYGAGWLGALGEGGVSVFSRYLVGPFQEATRVEIMVFIVCMLAMVGIMTRAGGIRGLMEGLTRLAHSARRCQAATFLMGLTVFFDHYANAILVGSTMRPLTDRFRVAREKLAYIVDSTAAPVAGLSLFSTWIAFEVSTFSVQLPEAGMAVAQGYEVFLRTIPFRFYSLFTLFLVGLLVFTGRDFGPMLRAERRARGGRLLRDGARPLAAGPGAELGPAEGVRAKARVALLPLAVFVGATLLAIGLRGGAFADPSILLSVEGITRMVYRGSGANTLMLGSAIGLAAAAVCALWAGLGGRVGAAAVRGVATMRGALLLLLLAWMIGEVCRDLGTATYLSVLISEALNPLLLPVFLFLIAGLVALATGSSWSTMTILLPLVVGLAYEAGLSTPIGGQGMLVVAIGAVLEGAIFGDHCSPISDTTVMSSMASSSDHVDHVRTQAPYAALAMAATLVCGYFPAVIVGLSPYLSLVLGGVAMAVFVRVYGRRPEATGADETGASLPEELRPAA